MNNYSFEKGKYIFRRINKKAAEKAYKNGLSVIFCPCNLRPDNDFYHFAMEFNKNNQNCDNMSFSTVLSHFEYYNCCNSETGKYTAFYIPVTDKIETYLDYNRSGKYENYDYSYLNETNILF